MKAMLPVDTHDREVRREARGLAQLGAKRSGRGDVLDHVEQQHVVELGEIQRRHAGVEIVLDEAVELDPPSERELVDADHAAALGLERLAHVAAGAADVEHARAARHGIEAMVCGLGKSSWADRSVGDGARRAVVLAVVEQVHLLGARAGGRDHDVGRVAQPVHVADLVAVIGRDRHLEQALLGQHELDDDLGVEVEDVGVEVERDRLEGATE